MCFFKWKKKEFLLVLNISCYPFIVNLLCMFNWKIRSSVWYRCLYYLLLPYSPQPIYYFGRVFNITPYIPSPKHFIAHNFKIDWDKQLLIQAKLTWKTSYEGQSFLLDNDKPWCSHKNTSNIHEKFSRISKWVLVCKNKHQGQHGQNAYTKNPGLYPNN